MALERGPSLTEQAADEIRVRIVRGALQLGESLSEIMLAKDLGVSKTPVREALMQLKREGLVEVHPQRGTFVFSMSPEQVGELSELRGILETAALRLALERNAAALVQSWAGTVGEMKTALSEKRRRTLPDSRRGVSPHVVRTGWQHLPAGSLHHHRLPGPGAAEPPLT